MKRIAIMQPTYFPWLGYFDLIAQVDEFVFLDNVQIVRKTANSFDCRNRIKTPQGELFLVCPIQKGTHTLHEICFNNTYPDSKQDWRSKHLRSIEMNYKKAPFFNEVFPLLNELIQQQDVSIATLNISIIKKISLQLGLNTKFILASEMPDITGEKDIRLVNMCHQLQANFYLSPKGAHVYIEAHQPSGAFANSGITLKYQNYQPQNYRQLHGNFIPYLSIIDLLFNCGFEQALPIIQQGSQSFLSSSDF